jgi:glucose-6-phosphate 1-dehydrogenase
MTDKTLTMSETGPATVSTVTEEIGSPFPACPAGKDLDPCCVVLFGATGDLASRKLAPALYNLFLCGGLPREFAIIGTGRKELTDDQFRHRIWVALADFDMSMWEELAACLYYQRLDYESEESFEALGQRIREVSEARGTRGNRLFYFALPPSLYEQTAQMLGRAGLSEQYSQGMGWSRLVIEKPFGSDLKSAQSLNAAVNEFFSEDQVFRIDHYLAKETVQNVLVLRFANAIFEPLWNRRYIDRVCITAAESIGVENRAAYYDRAGVLRDMFQNHLMQLLALTAMEPPSRFEAERARDEKVKVFRSMRTFDEPGSRDSLILGQYDRGTIGGQDVMAYREEAGIASGSLTPTFAALKVFIDNWRWHGVPFILLSGKRLESKRTEIVIHFRPVPHSLFRNTLDETIPFNKLTVGVHPEEKITLTFQTKTPGTQLGLRSVTMDFHYLSGYNGPIIGAYEKAIVDCMLNDRMLFWRQDGLEVCWAFLDPVLRQCENCADREDTLHLYPAGVSVPDAVKPWLR